MKNIKNKKWIWITLAAALVLVIAVVLLWQLIVVDNVADVVIAEAGSKPDAGDFKIRDLNYPISFVTDMDRLKCDLPGDYPVVLSYRGREYDSVLRVQDTRAPAVALQDLSTFCSRMPEAEEFVVSCEDATPCTIAFRSPPDPKVVGKQTVTLVVTDAAGNETVGTSVLNSILDQTPPKISGAKNRMHFCGTEFDPMKGISVQDDLDPEPEIRVLSDVNPDVPGKYSICYEATDASGNMSYKIIRVDVFEDDTAPVITTPLDENPAEDCLVHFAGTEFDPLAGVSVSDDMDPNPEITAVTNVDPDVPGEYTVRYKATDASGNESFRVLKVQVLLDDTPPVLYGVYDCSVYAGGTIAYKRNVRIIDDYDAAPTLTVDSSAVDINTPGTYPVVYTATDASGNAVRQEITVTVAPRNGSWVDEATIEAAVEEVASQILTDDMTPKEQVWAIYHWAHRKYYSGFSDKTDWRQAGYQLIKTSFGDCYSFFGASKLLFEYCGIPNIDVHRLHLPCHNTDHIWNMVSIDGGENYYYYDATPLQGTSQQFCLVTDEYLDLYSGWYGEYFSRDRSVLPDTPLDPPE